MHESLKNFIKKSGWNLHTYQKEAIDTFETKITNLLITAPTGSGKTYAAWFSLLNYYLQKKDYAKGLKVIWITPLRALTSDIATALQRAVDEIGLDWKVETRSADVSYAKKKKQLETMPDCLVTTPESLQLLISYPENHRFFNSIDFVVVDEWHELLGSKRGVFVELGLSYLKDFGLKSIIGISATIGNIKQAAQVLFANKTYTHVKSNIEKEIEIKTIIPPKIESFSWAGHIGTRLIKQIIEIINSHNTVLIFTNTRRQTEIWYKELLKYQPELAGLIGVHHSSLDKGMRIWIENALKSGKLKAVVCTSSLDLGVDFRPVDAVIQIGSPKSVARFIQRAGRAGHGPGEKSKVYFAPTYNLELIDADALKYAVSKMHVESKVLIDKPYDILVQYLTTRAIGSGYTYQHMYDELKNTYAYSMLTEKELKWGLDMITKGGSLESYEEFSKVELKDKRYEMQDKQKIKRHRLSIGAIISDPLIYVKYLKGKSIGTVEESFVSFLKPGDVFVFAGRILKFVKLQGNTLYVCNDKSFPKKSAGFYGSRMQLSSQFAEDLRYILKTYIEESSTSIEYETLKPIFKIQKQNSQIPNPHSLVVEKLQSHVGFHLYLYPLAGRAIHEALASLIAYRFTQNQSISLSIGINDLGIELFSQTNFLDHTTNKELEILLRKLLSTKNLEKDLESSVDFSELAKRQFREIAQFSGLLFTGLPGDRRSSKHLSTSSDLLYSLFQDYEPKNLLLQQAKKQVTDRVLNSVTLLNVLTRIKEQKIEIYNIPYSTPFSFPIRVESLRDTVSSEKLEDVVERYKIMRNEEGEMRSEE